MGNRLLFTVLAVIVLSSFAFAGPQVVVSDPGCTHTSPEIQLTTNLYSFVYGGEDSITFCNQSPNEETWTTLNFTISSPTPIDLNGFYCGSPEDFTVAAFDYCQVSDPTNGDALLHEFDTTYSNFETTVHDTPSSFYQNDQCNFGCPTSGELLGNVVHLSFNLYGETSFFQIEAVGCEGPCGLQFDQQFTLTFGCDAPNTDTLSHPCEPLPIGSTVSFLASSFPTDEFPPAVPEPATIAMFSTGALALLRRRFKK